MGLLVKSTETSKIIITGTTIEMPEVYCRIEFAGRANGITLEIAASNYASKIAFKEAFFYRIVSSNLQDLSNVNYDIIAFFSPADIRSLFENFPAFAQNNTVIAAWGATTIKAIKDDKLIANIQAPTPETPSMVAAIDKFIVEINKEK